MKILMVIDMQVDFVTGVLGSQQAQAIVPNVVNKIKEYLEKGWSIGFTRDGHDENYLKTREGKHLPVPHCIIGTEGYELIPEIKEVIEPYLDATITINGESGYQQISFIDDKFNQFGLPIYECCEPYEEDNIVESIEFIGVATNMCVISCAICMQNLDKNTEIEVDASCCASFDTELHNKALDVMESIHMTVTNR